MSLVYVRPWNNKTQGGYQAFLKEPLGMMQIAELALPIRVRKVSGERLLDLIDQACRAMYPSPGLWAFVEGVAQAERRATTLEVLPA